MSQRLLPLEVPDESLSCFDELPVPLLSPLHLPLDVPLGLECVPLDESFASPLDELRARCMQSWRSLAPDMFLHICIASADEPLPPSLLVPAPELFPPAVLSWLDGRVLGYAGLCTLVTAVLAALLPAWHTARLPLFRTR